MAATEGTEDVFVTAKGQGQLLYLELNAVAI
jgi:hypothetical protein